MRPARILPIAKKLDATRPGFFGSIGMGNTPTGKGLLVSDFIQTRAAQRAHPSRSIHHLNTTQNKVRAP